MITGIASLALIALEIALAPAVMLFFLEILASLAPPPPSAPSLLPPFAVLVPAHDEADGIGAVLRSITTQLGPSDALVVVTDNCSDETAAVAARAGAIVTERIDPERRGKGYALEHGIRFIAALDRYPVTIVVDADCIVADGALAKLAGRAHAERRPVQAAYLMEATPNADLRTRFAIFAFRVKNLVRLTGGRRLGVPSLLTGSGMAFPTRLLLAAELGSAEIVEDLVLGIAFTRAGTAPVFCSDALVTSRFPEGREARDVQRRRWEHGYLSVIRRSAIPLAWAGVRRRSLGMILLAADVAIPPLSLLIGSVAIVAVAAAIRQATAVADVMPSIGATALGLMLMCALLVAWLRFGRDLLSMADAARIPFMVVAKLPTYLPMLAGKKPGWVRTARTGPPHRSHACEELS